MTYGRVLSAVALTGWFCLRAQSCVPTQTGTESDDCLGSCSLGSSYTPANCPLCKSVTYRVQFPDGSSPVYKTLNGTGAYNEWFAGCRINTSYVYDARITQCWPSYSVPTMTTSYFYNDERDRTAIVANNMCGLVMYNFGVSCSDLPGRFVSVSHTCTCVSQPPSCPTWAHPSCFNGAWSCCATCNDGSNVCRTTCNQPCGSACLDCTVCNSGLQPSGCANNSPICSGTPVVLDPFNEGFHLTSLANGVKFRELPSGLLSQMSWTDPRWHNGWLVLDRDGDGTIDDLTELFGNLTPQPASENRNGFLALAVFDDPANGGNGNGAIDPGDSVYSHLRVWIDANHNGVSEPGELHTLQELGIFKIGLKYHTTPFVDPYGNRFRYRGTVWDEGGNGRDVCYDVVIQIQLNTEGS